MQWLESIQRIRGLKLSLARLDPYAGMPIAPPAGASPHAIARAERRLGFRLPPSYRALLACHDGWPHLFAGASLLGVRALERATFVDIARMVMEEHVPRLTEEAPRQGRRRARLVPFGIDAEAEAIFAWDTSAVRPDGELGVVLWLNDVGERLVDFSALLQLIAEMLSAELDDRSRAAPERSAPQDRAAALRPIWRAEPQPRSTPRPRFVVPSLPLRNLAVG